MNSPLSCNYVIRLNFAFTKPEFVTSDSTVNKIQFTYSVENAYRFQTQNEAKSFLKRTLKTLYFDVLRRWDYENSNRASNRIYNRIFSFIDFPQNNYYVQQYDYNSLHLYSRTEYITIRELSKLSPMDHKCLKNIMNRFGKQLGRLRKNIDGLNKKLGCYKSRQLEQLIERERDTNHYLCKYKRDFQELNDLKEMIFS